MLATLYSETLMTTIIVGQIFSHIRRKIYAQEFTKKNLSDF